MCVSCIRGSIICGIGAFTTNKHHVSKHNLPDSVSVIRLNSINTRGAENVVVCTHGCILVYGYINKQRAQYG